ncbi:MAG: hypothetical protein ICV68_00785 [Pyrinomonadaceae bacterium]|nr:hypothetical protein [Pyrinomonadaceae bacterium]
MKRVCLITITMLAMSFLVVAQIGSANPASLAQEQGAKKGQDKDKNKTESDKKVSGALGTKDNPVRCDSPRGERQYLNRLRCKDGNPPAYERIGSFAPGPYGNILDGYNVKCDGSDEVIIFMDMYHDGYVEKEAVPGFTIVNE